MREKILVFIFTIYERIFGWGSRVEITGEESLPPGPFIYAFWQRYIGLLTYSHRARGITVLASTSRDGRIARGVGLNLGYNIVEGTASSPATGARALIKLKAVLNRKSRKNIIA
ncbi:MAG: DUF374 domain-containing protein, partial [Elusimicrobia bacterium]|nr:DUF374 domain-containing protein [Elusimicrobiota bacterium]